MLERAVASQASCVIAAEEIVLPGKTVLRTAKPKSGVCKSGRAAAGTSSDRYRNSSDGDCRSPGADWRRMWASGPTR